MRLYYNTLPGFFFPEPPEGKQPPVGTPTPYLRHFDAATGQFVGDAVYGNRDGNQFADANALAITYHPVWPVSAPVLQMAATLTTPKRGLPAMRGQSSVEVLYQQSQVEPGANGQLSITDANRSVILHDPTREKTVEFNQADLPDSVNTETSRGKILFPNLPPHLVKRFWLDPNRGANGALVFAGEFFDAPLGDDYLFLNVAGPRDVAALRNLCQDGDGRKTTWTNAVNRLSTVLEQFVENPGRLGTFLPFTPTSFPPGITNVAGLTDVAAIYDDDVAVDSYALTANRGAHGREQGGVREADVVVVPVRVWVVDQGIQVEEQTDHRATLLSDERPAFEKARAVVRWARKHGFKRQIRPSQTAALAYPCSMQATAEQAAFERGVHPVARIVFPEKAQAVLAFRPDPALLCRIEELAEKSTEGQLTEPERAEYARYVRANKFIAVLQRLARQTAAA